MYSRTLGLWTVGVLAVCGPAVGCGPSVGDVDDSSTSTSGEETTGSTSTSTSSADVSTTIGETTLSETGEDVTTSADTSSFIMQPDGGTVHPCDLWGNNECPEGEKCMPVDESGGGSWDNTRCVPIDPDPKDVGASCTPGDPTTGEMDECVVGAMCWYIDFDTNTGECVGFCDGDETEPTCSEPCTRCFIPGDGILSLCLPSCDPIAQDCNEGDGCYGINDTFACAPDVGDVMGGIGDPCEFINVCDEGTFCAPPDAVPDCQGARGCCTPFCNVDAVDECDAIVPGTVCVPWFEEGQEPDPDPSCMTTGTVGGCVVP